MSGNYMRVPNPGGLLGEYRIPRRFIVLATVAVSFTFLGSLMYSNPSHPYVQAATKAFSIQTTFDLDNPILDRIIRLTELKDELIDRFDVDWATKARDWNTERIDHLIHCLAGNTCLPKEKEIVILGSGHFGASHIPGFVSGEDIWALSVDEAVESLNYTALYAFGHMEVLSIWLAVPDMVKHIFFEAGDLELCYQREAQVNENIRDGDFGDWQHVKIGCIKKPGFEEGIPLWKAHAFHGWAGPAHPLGPNFTVSLENFRDMGIGSNYYIGYSIEKRCKAIPIPEEREHRALILGKDTAYFKADRNMFPGMLASTAASMPEFVHENGTREAFKLTAVAGGRHQELDEKGIENLGFMPMADWYQEVAKSKMLVGLGSPPQSPSAYDALCLGVPFLNPTIWWDENDPHDVTKWQAQHPFMSRLPEPYVYQVHKGDQEGFARAIKSAIDNPIERYIPPAMTAAAMTARMKIFLEEMDWYDWAEQAIEELYVKENKEFPYLL